MLRQTMLHLVAAAALVERKAAADLTSHTSTRARARPPPQATAATRLASQLRRMGLSRSRRPRRFQLRRTRSRLTRPPPAESMSTTVQNAGSLDDGQLKVTVANPLASGFASRLLAQVICGIWVTAATGRLVKIGHDNDTYNPYVVYSLVVGILGIVLPIIALAMLKFYAKTMDKELHTVKKESITPAKAWAMFLVLWWGAGAGIGTFHIPFKVTGNGYFALWAGFLFASWGLSDVMDSVKAKCSTVNGQIDGSHFSGPARGLFCAAVVLLIATIDPVDDGDNTTYFGEALFGLIASAITIAVCVVLMLVEKLDQKIVKLIAFLLGLTWAAVAGIMTFRAPFLVTGNGYFSSYAGLFMAFQLVAVAFLEH